MDFQPFSGRDVLISDAEAGDARASLGSRSPHKEVATPVASRTPRIFSSVDRGTATLVGANFLEDSTQAFAADEHVGRYLKTDDDQFYYIQSHTALRLTVDAGGATPSLGSYSIFEFGQARGILTLSGNAADTETVVIDGKTYTFQAVLTDTDGNVLVGGSASASIDNLVAAITLGAGAGTTYAASTTLHTTVTASAGAGDTMDAFAKTGGAAGDAITTTETLGFGAWGGGTFSMGADPLTPGTDYAFNRSTGDLELTTGLLEHDALVAADDGATVSTGAYTFTQGLGAFAQDFINGDPDNFRLFPGVKSTGTQVTVLAPTIVSPVLTIQVIGTSGTTDDDLTELVQVTIQAYVNSLGIGDNVILAEIIRRVKGLANVRDTKMVSPTTNVTIAAGQLARITDAQVVVV
jgi:hypothetical protein